MIEPNEYSEIANPRFKYMFTVLMDTLYLGLWIGAQWGVNAIIKTLPLEGVDLWTFLAFQIFFAITTFVPILVNFWTDVRIMLIRSRNRITMEKIKSKELRETLELPGDLKIVNSTEDGTKMRKEKNQRER